MHLLALGQINLQESVVMEVGIRMLSKEQAAQRSSARTAPGFGVRRPEWNRHAMSAYTWLRTDKGPQKHWLHKSSTCQCGHHTQDGRHITFDCPNFRDQRAALGSIKDWEDLDRPIWIQEEEGDDWDAVEARFGFLYRRLTGRGSRP